MGLKRWLRFKFKILFCSQDQINLQTKLYKPLLIDNNKHSVQQMICVMRVLVAS